MFSSKQLVLNPFGISCLIPDNLLLILERQIDPCPGWAELREQCDQPWADEQREDDHVELLPSHVQRCNPAPHQGMDVAEGDYMVNIRGVDHARDEPHTHEQDRGQHVPVPAVVGLLDAGEDKPGITTTNNPDRWDDNRNGSCCHPIACVSDATVFGAKVVCQENCKHGDCGKPP